ncbi:hypothetical protein Ppa06_25910 [Planomonospora parontospora subsp. parontospora]|uniref:Uncharacterized protein n=2 Tax=Planomonospora parontospora TaxID=58119 RepID=A0AA37BES4_9ACTN|nr:hypothetical protein GCM10010126_19770 [Planomonospora parontospora]GII08793.1 hypothetical protein Ppa06_25910 [Planomonospora parontospora subsp. parontospora]
MWVSLRCASVSMPGAWHGVRYGGRATSSPLRRKGVDHRSRGGWQARGAGLGASGRGRSAGPAAGGGAGSGVSGRWRARLKDVQRVEGTGSKASGGKTQAGAYEVSSHP